MIDVVEARGLAKELLGMVDELNLKIASAYDKGFFINFAISERENVIGQPRPGKCPRLNIGVALDPKDLALQPGEAGYRDNV